MHLNDSRPATSLLERGSREVGSLKGSLGGCSHPVLAPALMAMVRPCEHARAGKATHSFCACCRHLRSSCLRSPRRRCSTSRSCWRVSCARTPPRRRPRLCCMCTSRMPPVPPSSLPRHPGAPAGSRPSARARTLRRLYGLQPSPRHRPSLPRRRHRPARVAIAHPRVVAEAPQTGRRLRHRRRRHRQRRLPRRPARPLLLWWHR